MSLRKKTAPLKLPQFQPRQNLVGHKFISQQPPQRLQDGSAPPPVIGLVSSVLGRLGRGSSKLMQKRAGKRTNPYSISI